MALVMCYVVINYRFIYSVLIHVLNNSLALLLPLFFMGTEAISGDNFEGELRNMKMDEFEEMYPHWIVDSTSVTFYGELPEMVNEIDNYCFGHTDTKSSNGELRIFYPDNTYLWTRYVLDIKINGDSVDCDDIVNALIKSGRLKSDTTMVPALEVSIADMALYKSQLSEYESEEGESLSLELLKQDTTGSYFPLEDFLDWVSSSYSLPLVVTPSTDPETPVGYYWELDGHTTKSQSLLRMVYDPTASLDIKPTKEDVIKALREQYGLAVKESKTKKIRQVEFYVGGSF